MEKKWTRSVRSMIALLLCAAMLLPMLPQVVVRADTTGSTSGFSGTIVAGGTKTENESVPTVTPQFKLEKVEIDTNYVGTSYTSATDVTKWLFQGHSYAVGSEYGNSLLSYSAAGKTEGTADNTNVAGFTDFDEENGVITFDPIYRDEVLWKLTQGSAWNIANNAPFSPYTSDGKTLLQGNGPLSNYYPFTAAFQGFVLEKGTSGYWYSTTSDAYRYLNLTPSSSNKFSNTSDSSASNRIEYYGDGVFQIFYAGSANVQSSGTYRMWEFLRGDYDSATQPWVTAGINQSSYVSSDSSVGGDMKNNEAWAKRWRLNLYHYTELDAMRTLSYSGYNTYYVMQGESAESILAKIQENITLEDTNGYTVLSNGRTDKVGYYWLDTTMKDTPEAEKYTVTVKYRNDNGTDTVVDTISVTVQDVKLGTNTDGSDVVGYISKNSLQSAYVFDGVASGASAISVKFGESNLPITVNMLYTSYTNETENTRLDVTKPGTYTGVKVMSGTREIGTMTIVIANGTIAAHTPVTGAGSVSVDKTGVSLNTVDGKGNNLANIQLSALGTAKETGVDLIVVLDLSSSMRYGANTSFEVSGPYYNYKGELNTKGYYLDQTNADYNQWKYVDTWNVKATGSSEAASGHYKNWAADSWQDTRMYDLEVALQSMIETLQQNNTDVQIAITDFGDLDHYEFTDAVQVDSLRVWPVLDGNANNQMDYQRELTNHLNFVLGRDDYEAGAIWSKLNNDNRNWVSQPFDLHEWKYFSSTLLNRLGVASDFQGKQDPTIYTGNGIITDAFTDVDLINLGVGENGTCVSGGIIEKLRISNSKMLGTNYDVGLEYAYKLAYARQQQNIANGEDREIMCVFMSDGAAMQYNYFSGRSITEAWSQMIIGETDEVLTNHDDAANLNIVVNDAGQYVFEDYDSLTPKFQYILGVMHNWLAQANKLDDHSKGKLAACGCGQRTGTAMATLQEFGRGLPACLNRMTGNAVTMYDIFRNIYKNQDIIINGLKDYYGWVVQGYTANQTEVYVENTYISGLNDDGTPIYGTETLTYPRSYNQSMLELIKELTAPNNSTDAEGNTTNYEYQTMSPYYYFYNADGKNWWAEAIKGDTDKVYPVINKYAKGNTATGATNPISYNGEAGYTDNFAGVAGVSVDENTTYYTASDGTKQPLELSGKDYISGFQGLGMRLYTIGFAIATENLITAEEANTVLKNLASGPNYYYSTENRGELTTALNSIVGEVTQASTFGYFTDTMGEEFDLYTAAQSGDYSGTYYDENGTLTEYSISSTATIKVFKTETSAKGTNDQYTYTDSDVLETIWFGGVNVAYSSLIYTEDETTGEITYTDIWDETRNIIQGTYVVYNLNKLGSGDTTLTDSAAITASLLAGNIVNGTVMINLDSDAELDFRLAPETFFWTIGNIPQEYRIVLEYQAYMEESMEGTLPLKDQYYDTNTEAILTYVDYLGNLVTKDTESPELPWKEQALYKYAYYQVNVNGQPVDASGNVTSDPAQYVYFTNNGQYYTGVVSSVDSSYTSLSKKTTITTQEVTDHVPEDYVLYDSNAGVTITTTLAYATADEEDNPIKVPDKHTITPNDPAKGLSATTLVKDTTAAVSDIENGELRNNIIYFAVYVPPKATSIKFSFYLVDESGTPLNKNGTATTWADSYKLKDGASTVEVTVGENTLTLTPEGKLADYCEKNGLDASLFEIYDASATAAVNADYTAPVEHKVTLSKGDDKNASTYIDTATTDPSSVTGDHTITGADALTTTEVSFAVKLKSQAEDDVIVVDFGLPVNITVLGNDGLNGMTLNGISNGEKGTPTAYNTSKVNGTSFTDTFGKGEIKGSEVKYTPTTMSFDGYDLFSYEAKYTSKVTDKEGTETSTDYFYTANVTVIPATIIYYEDNVTDGTDTLITYKTFTVKYDDEGNVTDTPEDSTSGWENVGETSSDWEQDEDRPGTGANGIDANNVYGMDSHYKNMVNYSMGSAMKVHVEKGSYATAEFTFTGTGFDVISLTDSTTGTILVKVTDANGNTEKTAIVDTYYGYSYEDGKWTESGNGSLYQVPVIKMTGLAYGVHKVTITVTYMDILDQTAADGYDFYLDAIRIYDPAETAANTTDNPVKNAYELDKEGWPEYFELRNLILSTKDLNLQANRLDLYYNGVVFIDKGEGTNEFAVSDYHNYGPNNELYLAPGQSIAFKLNVTDENLAGIHMAVKSVGGAAKLTYYTLGSTKVTEEISSATDLYYDITTLNKNTVVISNTGTEGILSITNMKVTYTAEHEDSLDAGYLSIATSNIVEVLEMMGDQVSGSDDSNNTEGSTGSEEITIKSASLSLAGEVYVNYYFETGLGMKTNNGRVTNAGLLIWNSDPGENPDYDTADTKVKGAFTTTTTGRYVAQTPGIAAKDLGNTLYTCAYVVDEDGITSYSEVRDYSPRTYAYNMLNRLENSTEGDNVELKQLCAALLNYGAAAQVYFDANEVPLVNNELYKYNVTVPEYGDVKFTNVAHDATEWFKAEYIAASIEDESSQCAISTSFSGALALNFYIKLSDNSDYYDRGTEINLYFWDNSVTGNLSMDNVTKTVTLMDTGNGMYSYTLTDITSKEIGDEFHFAVGYWDYDGLVFYYTDVCSYSVYDYCVNKVLSDDDYATATDNEKNLSDLAKATAVYGYCAKQYFDAVS